MQWTVAFGLLALPAALLPALEAVEPLIETGEEGGDASNVCNARGSSAEGSAMIQRKLWTSDRSADASPIPSRGVKFTTASFVGTSPVEGSVMGSTATHDAEGWHKVLDLQSKHEREAFLRSVMKELDLTIVSAEQFRNFAAWVGLDGEMQDKLHEYKALVQDLRSLSQKPCSWVNNASRLVNTSGATAKLDEAGYRSVASLRNNKEMRTFIARVIKREGFYLVVPGGLDGLVPFHSCERDVQSLERLEDEMRNVASGSDGWISKAFPKKLVLSAMGMDRKIVRNNPDHREDSPGEEDIQKDINAVAMQPNGVGTSAELSEDGYYSVATTKSNLEMTVFILRIVRDMGMQVVNEAQFNGIVPYYSGELGFQTYETLRKELEKLSKEMCAWLVKENKEEEDFETDGKSVPMTEAGYKAVAKMHSPIDMRDFAYRVLEDMHMQVTDKGGLMGFLPFHDCEQGAKTLKEMRNEIHEASGKKAWCRPMDEKEIRALEQKKGGGKEENKEEKTEKLEISKANSFEDDEEGSTEIFSEDKHGGKQEKKEEKDKLDIDKESAFEDDEEGSKSSSSEDKARVKQQKKEKIDKSENAEGSSFEDDEEGSDTKSSKDKPGGKQGEEEKADESEVSEGSSLEDDEEGSSGSSSEDSINANENQGTSKDSKGRDAELNGSKKAKAPAGEFDYHEGSKGSSSRTNSSKGTSHLDMINEDEDRATEDRESDSHGSKEESSNSSTGHNTDLDVANESEDQAIGDRQAGSHGSKEESSQRSKVQNSHPDKASHGSEEDSSNSKRPNSHLEVRNINEEQAVSKKESRQSSKGHNSGPEKKKQENHAANKSHTHGSTGSGSRDSKDSKSHLDKEPLEERAVDYLVEYLESGEVSMPVDEKNGTKLEGNAKVPDANLVQGHKSVEHEEDTVVRVHHKDASRTTKGDGRFFYGEVDRQQADNSEGELDLLKAPVVRNAKQASSKTTGERPLELLKAHQYEHAKLGVEGEDTAIQEQAKALLKAAGERQPDHSPASMVQTKRKHKQQPKTKRHKRVAARKQAK